jgi:nucleotide-binding universal stress UspA family protein
LRRILIAADESHCTVEAVRQGATSWLPPQSVVQVLSVIPPSSGHEAPGAYYHRAAESAQVALDQAIDQLERAGHQAAGLIRNGDPAAMIAAAAREFDADLILMGTHGFRPDSVAEAVSRAATCGVLICRLHDRSVAC